MTEDRAFGAPGPDLETLLRRSAETGLAAQRADGSMPPGHNGPWTDRQTPLRTTGHWATLFAFVGDRTGEARYREAARAGLDYLTSPDHRPAGATLTHREADGKDAANGLVGQAWTIAALARCSVTLEDPDALALAREVFAVHPFDADRGLFHAVDTDETDLGVHTAINQHVWLAASGAVLVRAARARGADASAVDERVRAFLDRLPGTLDHHRTGLIRHAQYHHERPLRRRLASVLSARRWQRQGTLARGYHSFVLLGLANLHDAYPGHDVWTSPAVERVIDYTGSTCFLADVEANPFAFGYNPTGFEVAAFAESLPGTDLDADYWIDEQIRRTWDASSGAMTDGPDPATLAARAAEAVRLVDPDWPFDGG